MATADDYKDTLTIKEAAALVRVSRRTIYNWLIDGKLRTAITAGGQTRIFVDSLFQQPKEAQ